MKKYKDTTIWKTLSGLKDQIKFLIYLTDCNENNGYFELNEITDKLRARHKKITGTAGTLIDFDN